MIRLNVFIQVNESNRNAVLETAKELVAQSLNDKGCTIEFQQWFPLRKTPSIKSWYQPELYHAGYRLSLIHI